MVPEHVSQHESLTRATTWAPVTSQNMSPLPDPQQKGQEYVPEHVPRTRPERKQSPEPQVAMMYLTAPWHNTLKLEQSP